MSERKPSYLWAAFNARPLGMPIPPNYFYLAAMGLLGVFASPGFLVLGLAGELAYLWGMSQSKRFRKTVDARQDAGDPTEQRYRDLLLSLSAAQRARQEQIEARAREIMSLLGRSPLMSAHADSLDQLVWLHLRLLGARQALGRVVETAREDSARLAEQEAQLDARLADPGIGEELRRSLEQQKAVIDARQAAHEQAARRQEHVDAELQRIEQQVALIREQALLATDEERIGASLNALTASFNEANRWLDSQRDLIGVFDAADAHGLPQRVLRRGGVSSRSSAGESA